MGSWVRGFGVRGIAGFAGSPFVGSSFRGFVGSVGEFARPVFGRRFWVRRPRTYDERRTSNHEPPTHEPTTSEPRKKKEPTNERRNDYRIAVTPAIQPTHGVNPIQLNYIAFQTELRRSRFFRQCRGWLFPVPAALNVSQSAISRRSAPGKSE